MKKLDLRLTERGAKVIRDELKKLIDVKDGYGAHLPDDHRMADIREAHRELSDVLKQAEGREGDG